MAVPDLSVYLPKDGKPDLKERGDTGMGYWGWVSPGTERRIREIEYLPRLRGMQAYKVYDRMRLSDPKLYGLLAAVDLPILKADPRIESADKKSDEANKRAEFVKSVLLERMCYPWRSTLEEILLYRPLGYSAFEIIWKVEDGDVIIDRLAYRPPETIWWIWGQDGRISHVEQIIFGHWLTIDGSKLLWFTHKREGENWRGRPILRPLYKPWYAKERLEVQLLILTEKMGGVPVFRTGPSVNEKTEQVLDEAGRNWAIKERMFLRIPNDVEFELAGSNIKAADVIREIEYYDTQMSNTLIAQVLDLGKTATGSRALGETLGDMFELSCEATANSIEDEINRREGLIHQLCVYNFPDGDDPDLMPKFRFGKIGKVDPLVFGNGLQFLTQAGLSFNDPITVEYIRQLLGLPQLDTDDLQDIAPDAGGEPILNPDGTPALNEDGTPKLTPQAPGQAPGGTLPAIAGLPTTPGGAAQMSAVAKHVAGQLQHQSDAEAMASQNAAALQAGISPETQPDAKANLPLPTETEQTSGALNPAAIKSAKQAQAAKPARGKGADPQPTSGAVNDAAARKSPQAEGTTKIQPKTKNRPTRGSVLAERKIRLAEGKTWRDPKGVELYADLAELSDGFDAAKDAIRSATQDTRDAMVRELIKRAKASPSVADFAAGRPPMVDALAGQIKAVLAKSYDRGRQQLTDEIDRQKRGEPVVAREIAIREGKRIAAADHGFRGRDLGAPPATPSADSASHIDQQAQVAARKIADATKHAVAEQVLSHVITPMNADVLERMVLRSSDTAALQCAGTVTRLMDLGRSDAAQSMADQISKGVYSALLDNHTCSECEGMDGSETEDLSEAAAWAPNPSCEGGDACRCLVFYEYDQGAGSGPDQGVEDEAA